MNDNHSANNHSVSSHSSQPQSQDASRSYDKSDGRHNPVGGEIGARSVGRSSIPALSAGSESSRLLAPGEFDIDESLSSLTGSSLPPETPYLQQLTYNRQGNASTGGRSSARSFGRGGVGDSSYYDGESCSVDEHRFVQASLNAPDSNGSSLVAFTQQQPHRQRHGTPGLSNFALVAPHSFATSWGGGGNGGVFSQTLTPWRPKRQTPGRKNPYDSCGGFEPYHGAWTSTQGSASRDGGGSVGFLEDSRLFYPENTLRLFMAAGGAKTHEKSAGGGVWSQQPLSAEELTIARAIQCGLPPGAVVGPIPALGVSATATSCTG